uniref:Baculoviral IAP repeat containing 5b n=1 Tax=Salmo trutta TaxID=8032 RepID=A0A674E8Z2_SALTR
VYSLSEHLCCCYSRWQHRPLQHSFLLLKKWFVHGPSENELDVACCFFCLRELECWEPEDNPWSEHIKRSPNCGFLAIRKDFGELTVSGFYHLEQERLHIYIVSHQPYPIYFDTVSYIRNCIVPNGKNCLRHTVLLYKE